MNVVGTGRVELPSLLPSLFGIGRGFTDKLSAQMSPDCSEAQIIIKICRWVKNSPELS